VLLAALAVCAFAALTVGSASAATLENGATALRAIYGFPPGSATEPIGGGLGRNFGFGENMLFRADKAAIATSENLHITLSGVVLEAGDTWIGGTLMSNTTGANNPLSFSIQFVDFQKNEAGGALTPSFADTSDRPWITEICSTSVTCKVDARQVGGVAQEVKIEDASFNVGPGIVVQGTVWGKWTDGTAAIPACIEIKKAPTAALEFDELVETQGAAVGAKPTVVGGKACLVSANNDYPPTTNVIKLK
jgi:hypothetical protein